MNTANDKPRIHRVQDEIMNLLSLNSDPMTARDLITLCESHEAESDIHKAVGSLVRAGRIEVAGTTEGARGATARLYRIANNAGTDTELMSHLERDLAGAGAGPNIPLDSAHGSTLADEFERSGPMQPGKCSYGSDPILSAIERLEEPRIVDALRDAMLLRALADSPALRSEPDVGQWLQDLAEKLDRRAA